ncbi:MAG: hypothetical protein ABIZ69_00795 [Ilumatobacteraceae bacterium]
MTLAMLVLVGCGSDAGKTATTGAITSSPASSAGSVPSSVTAGDTTPTTKPAAVDASGNPLDGAAFCAFLQQDLPALKSAGSAAGALAQFAGDFGVWLDGHQSQKPRTADDLDAASEPVCPDVRSQAVAALGTDSFVAALG